MRNRNPKISRTSRTHTNITHLQTIAINIGAVTVSHNVSRDPWFHFLRSPSASCATSPFWPSPRSQLWEKNGADPRPGYTLRTKRGGPPSRRAPHPRRETPIPGEGHPTQRAPPTGGRVWRLGAAAHSPHKAAGPKGLGLTKGGGDAWPWRAPARFSTTGPGPGAINSLG